MDLIFLSHQTATYQHLQTYYPKKSKFIVDILLTHVYYDNQIKKRVEKVQ